MKMTARRIGLVMAAGMFCAFLTLSAQAQYRANWNYHSGDLSGSNCLQQAVDELAQATGVRPGVTNQIESTLTAANLKLAQASTQACTNGGTYTVTNVVNRLVASGGPANGTNTISLARPPTGTEMCLLVNAGATNRLYVASSGSLNGPAIDLGTDEAVMVFGVKDADGTGTNAWYTLSRLGATTNQAVITSVTGGTNTMTMRIVKGLVISVQ